MKSFKPKTLAGVLLAGFLALLPGQTRAEVTLEMAYMPIVPCAQLFVIEGMG